MIPPAHRSVSEGPHDLHRAPGSGSARNFPRTREGAVTNPWVAPTRTVHAGTVMAIGGFFFRAKDPKALAA